MMKPLYANLLPASVLPAGHATSWNGLTCSDHCYFDGPEINYTTTKANFLVLS